MTDRKLMEMAHETHRALVTIEYLNPVPEHDPWTAQLLKSLAGQAAAHEREACAKLCEKDGLLLGQRYAAAIRARREKK